MPEFPNYFQLEEIEREFDRRGDLDGKRQYRLSLYVKLLLKFVSYLSPEDESADDYHVRRYLRDRLSEADRIKARQEYSARQVDCICAAAALLRSGVDSKGRTVFYGRVGQRIGVSRSRVAQVFGSARHGGLNWLSGTWDEFRANVLTAAAQIGCR